MVDFVLCQCGISGVVRADTSQNRLLFVGACFLDDLFHFQRWWELRKKLGDALRLQVRHDLCGVGISERLRVLDENGPPNHEAQQGKHSKGQGWDHEFVRVCAGAVEVPLAPFAAE
eukprot:jgi/Chlat1/8347/Chrsp8S08111